MANLSIFLTAASIFGCSWLSAGPSAAEPAPPAQKRSTEEFLKTLSPEGRKDFALMEERDRLAEKYRVRDRKLHVRPAPPDFKPEDASRKLKITLIPERTMIRKGKRFRYRAEIQNVGRENIVFSDHGSFILRGHHFGPPFKFLLVQKDGEELELINLTRHHFLPDSNDGFHPPPGWEKMSPQEKDEAIRLLNLEGKLGAEFSVNLQPGETVYTRDPRTGARFNDLFASHGFKRNGQEKLLIPVFEQAGTYKVKLIYDDLPPARPSEGRIEEEIKILGSRERVLRAHQSIAESSLGLFQSNIVTFEITQ